jgi:hypothetical protein
LPNNQFVFSADIGFFIYIRVRHFKIKQKRQSRSPAVVCFCAKRLSP